MGRSESLRSRRRTRDVAPPSRVAGNPRSRTTRSRDETRGSTPVWGGRRTPARRSPPAASPSTTPTYLLAVAFAILAAALPGAAQERHLVPDDAAWELAGDVEAGVVAGREALNLGTGEADRPDVRMADGTLEFDMRVVDRRTFVGVKLRVAEDGTYEDIYFRPHKSGLPDAVQYTPSWRGVGQWQLHHGPDATAFAHYRPGEWQHVRIELRGSRAAVFLDGDAEPVLVATRLRTGRREGAVGFWANQPGAGPDDPWTVSLADIRVRPGVTSWDFPSVPEEPTADGAIRRWEVTPASRGDAAALDALPDAVRDAPWTAVAAAPSGLVSLERWLRRPAEGPAMAFARVTLRAERALVARLDLGWSDDVTVFLDGRPVFTGRFGYSYNFPRRDGLITPDQATVHLPLEPGEHQVVVAVSDVFGGWGLMGRIVDRRGLEVVDAPRGSRPAPAQEAAPGAGPQPPPLALPRLDAPVEVDGVPDDDAWERVPPVPLTMYFPTFGGEPEQRSEIRVAYDDHHLYAAGWFWDDDPGGIRVNSLYRDRWNGDDAFALYVDAFNDNQNAKWFGTTPGGIRFDVLVTDDGQTTNASWNAFWEAETTVTDVGWFAEMRIPFSTLGFQVDGEGRAVMGLTVTRLVARTGERVTFPAIDPAFRFRQPSVARDVAVRDVTTSTPLYATPYALVGQDRTSGVDDDRGAVVTRTEPSREMGLDLRYPLSGTLTLDLTANTDFAQVEADDQQVNLDRFPLFFPEKRRFFQERSGIFDFAIGGGSRLFHSRRIGLTPDRTPVPVLGGARLVGRIGSWDVGLLNMQTGALGSVPSENFGVLRLRRQVLNPNSWMGVMATSRLGGGSHNLALGTDGSFRLFGDDYLTVRWAGSLDDADPRVADLVGRSHVDARWQRRVNRGLAYALEVTRSGAHFRPDVGFLPRRDHTSANVLANWYRFTDDHPVYRRVWPGMLAFSTFRNGDGTLESGQYAVWVQWETRAGGGGWIEPKVFHENVAAPFVLGGEAEVPAGRYTFADLQIVYDMPVGRRLRTGVDFRSGTFFDGTRTQVLLTPTWNVSPHLELGADFQLTRLRFADRGESADIHVARFRTRTALDSRASGNAFVQYDSATDRVGVNVRLRWAFAEGTDLWIVYDEGLTTERLPDPAGPRLPRSLSRTLILKYTHTFGL